MIDTLFRLGRPLLQSLDAEKAHALTINALKTGVLPGAGPVSSSSLEQTLCGLRFRNPIGIAAGFDKNAEVIKPLLGFGLGFVEVGTVTPKPQAGNPRPRIFRAPAHAAVINRMGFPNAGVDVFQRNVERFRAKHPRGAGVLGLNIGMNKDQAHPEDDYRHLVRELAELADYLTVNISSPNTPGLRDLQSKAHLVPLLGQILEERDRAKERPPLFVKLAPDLDDAQIEELSASVTEAGVDGLILTNTTLDRPCDLPSDFSREAGGLSGRPLTRKSTQVIAKFYAYTNGELPLIGVGGIGSGEDAYEKIQAGASLVQVYSALVFEGPGLIRQINEGLLAKLQQDGHAHISEAIGQTSTKWLD